MCCHCWHRGCLHNGRRRLPHPGASAALCRLMWPAWWSVAGSGRALVAGQGRPGRCRCRRRQAQAQTWVKAGGVDMGRGTWAALLLWPVTLSASFDRHVVFTFSLYQAGAVGRYLLPWLTCLACLTCLTWCPAAVLLPPVELQCRPRASPMRNGTWSPITNRGLALGRAW